MVKKSACNAEDLGSVPELGRSPREENGYRLQNSCLENSMDRGAQQATVHGVTKSQTKLSDSHTDTQTHGSLVTAPKSEKVGKPTWILDPQKWR